jgi:hypothetical protein
LIRALRLKPEPFGFLIETPGFAGSDQLQLLEAVR